MITLTLKHFDVATIWANKRPEYQKATSAYANGNVCYVKLIEIVYTDNRQELLLWNAIQNGNSYCGSGFDTLQERLDLWGWVLGEWVDSDTVELTERGECEAALLSSIPYLFGEGERMDGYQ